ncbi:MAG: LPD38 domain-containing protein, partial [Terricaulis sp.]
QAPPGGGLGLGNLAALHKLKGGKNPIADPIENIARNTFALTSLAMRNVAAQRIMRDGKALGYIKQVASDKVGGDVVKTWINGKPRYFQVLDKVLYDSVQASGIEVGSFVKLIGVGPAKFLRDMVTSDPVFMVKNALRDSTQLWMQGYSSAPFVNIAGGLRKALTNAESYDTLQRMGVIGTGVRGEGMDETASNLKGELGNHGLAKRFNEQRKRALAGSEAIGRITVYDAVRKRGGSPAQAAYHALELLNFNRKGASPFVQWVSALTPFLNAHAQGTDVIYRTMRGKAVGGKAQQRQLAMRGLALAGLTAAYALMSQGQDYYENATGEERDLYWFIPIPGTKEAFKIPTPFELALPFKVLPEHLVNLTIGDELPADAKKAAGRAMVSVFGIQPPQVAKPIVEGMVNFDFFRQRNIESESMKRLEPQMRHDDYTAEISKALGKATGYSPMQVDHLIKGYTGSMGVMALNLVDSILERNGPEMRPLSQPSTLPIGLGRMFQREGGGRMLVDFYELRDIAEQAVATQRAMAKQGIQDTPTNIQKRAQRAAVAKATEGMDDAIAKLRKYRKWANAAEDLTPATKRDALNEIRRREIEITKKAQPLRKMVR